MPTTDDSAVITALQFPPPTSPCGLPRVLGRAGYATHHGAVDIALVLLASDAGLRRSEAAELAWGAVVR